MAVGAVRLLVSIDLESWQRWLGWLLLGLLTATYAILIGLPTRRSAWRESVPNPSEWARYTYLTLAIIVAGLSCWLDGGLSLVLFIVFPQVWLFVNSFRAGAVVTCLLTVVTTTGFIQAEGWSMEAIRLAGPQMVASALFSILLGLWVYRVMEESHQRAELIAQLESTRAALAASHHTQGVMAERERMAREIHDTLAQGFTSVIMLAQAASAALERAESLPADDRTGAPPAAVPVQRLDRIRDRLDAVEDVARENLAEARALVAAFSPVDLDGSSLPEALRRLTERFARETGLTVDLETPADAAGLSRAQEVVALRAVQEALTNVRRHARAHRVSVRLMVDGTGARVEVGDDGVGFVPGDEVTGFGLAGMRGRVGDVGGLVDVASAPGNGTRVVVHLPGGTEDG
ncbi:MAG: sensor histidine kinase [Actinomycetales bacterium]|nr:sensor histidine kinase [Actinomycetales bacterium]